MKKLKIFANILIFTSLGLWALRAQLSYINYTRHIELFANEGWVWYTDVLEWGKFIVPIIVVCLVAKFILRKK